MSLLDLDKLEYLDNLHYMKGLKELQNLQKLDELKHMDKLQHIQNLDQLQKLDQLQHLDKLSNLQALSQLKDLGLLKHLQQLEKLHELERLQMLNRLGELERLNQLQNMQTLTRLDQLENLNQMQNLHALSNLQQMPNLHALSNLQQMPNLHALEGLRSLHQLEILNRLKVLDWLMGFNFTTLLYVFSVVVPGLVFQESAVLFTQGRIDLKRAMVLMVIYNVLNLLLGVLFIFPYFSQLEATPVVYYLAWFVMLVLAPIGFGWLLAMLIKMPRAERFSELLVARPRQVVANAWERFLTEADRYELVITLNNAEKMMGFFQKGSHAPVSEDPNDLYFTETAHYDPQATAWTDLEHPVHVWVKGSEIKMVEVSPQEVTS